MSSADISDTGFDPRVVRIAYLFQDAAFSKAREYRLELLETTPGFGRVVQHEGERGSFLLPLKASSALSFEAATECFLRLRKHKLSSPNDEGLPYHELDLNLIGKIYSKMLDFDLTRFGLDLYMRSDGQDCSTILSMAQYAHLTKDNEGAAGRSLLIYKTRLTARTALREIQAEDMIVDENARKSMDYCQKLLTEANLFSYGISLGYRDGNNQVYCGLPHSKPAFCPQRFRP